MCVQCSKDVKKCKSRELRASILYTSCDCIKRNGLQDSCPRSECQGSPACMVFPEPACCPAKHAQRYINMRANIGRNLDKCNKEQAKGSCGSCPPVITCPTTINPPRPNTSCPPSPCGGSCPLSNNAPPPSCPHANNSCPNSNNKNCPKPNCPLSSPPSKTGGCPNSNNGGCPNSNNCPKPNCPQPKPSGCQNRLGAGSDGDGPQYNFEAKRCCKRHNFHEEPLENTCHCCADRCCC